MIRLYQNSSLQLNQTIQLDQKNAHHLLHVLRATIGDEVQIFNGTGGEYQAQIIDIQKPKKNPLVSIHLQKFIDSETQSSIQLILGQVIARHTTMDFIIQKAVELGVNVITPLMSERCNYRANAAHRIHHWQDVAISACEQSGRVTLPEITTPQLLSVWLDQVSAHKKYVLLPQNNMNEQTYPHLSRLMPQTLTYGSSVIVLIGPEGGFTSAEVEAALHAQFAPLQLGPRILRTETAALAALTLMQFCYGDFEKKN